jgi:hypothetical protein
MATVVLAGLIYIICEMYVHDCNVFAKDIDELEQKGPKTPILPENHFYYNTYDKSNKRYDKCENGLKHDKAGFLAVQLSRDKANLWLTKISLLNKT